MAGRLISAKLKRINPVKVEQVPSSFMEKFMEFKLVTHKESSVWTACYSLRQSTHIRRLTTDVLSSTAAAMCITWTDEKLFLPMGVDR